MDQHVPRRPTLRRWALAWRLLRRIRPWPETCRQWRRRHRPWRGVCPPWVIPAAPPVPAPLHARASASRRRARTTGCWIATFPQDSRWGTKGGGNRTTTGMQSRASASTSTSKTHPTRRPSRWARVRRPWRQRRRERAAAPSCAATSAARGTSTAAVLQSTCWSTPPSSSLLFLLLVVVVFAAAAAAMVGRSNPPHACMPGRARPLT
jgi:hypothetical protein